MKKEVELREYFENLKPISPDKEWSEKLLLRVKEERSGKQIYFRGSWVLLAIFVLLLVNLLAISKGWKDEISRNNSADLKRIATEYLITSNSSNY